MDDMDRAQERAAIYTDETLARHQSSRSSQCLVPPKKRDCDDCDQPIPSARLVAVPDATRCIFCQTEHDEEMAR